MPPLSLTMTFVSSLAITSLLTLAVAAGASAQVATLVNPDAEAEPSPALAATPAPGPEDREEALLEYANCMRDNGIDMDDPRPGTAGGRGFLGVGAGPGLDVKSEEFQTAQMACAAILEAARPELDPEAQAERLEEMLTLAQCMREQGIEGYPDPVMGSAGRLERTAGRAFAELTFDPTSEAFQAAREACVAEVGVEVGPGAGLGPGNGGPGPTVDDR